MSDEHAKSTLKPGSEFWTIIGASVAMGALIVAMGALILTVTGWLREDIRDLGAGLNALRGEVSELAVGLKALEGKVDTIDRRLAVVESHVLGVASADRNDDGT